MKHIYLINNHNSRAAQYGIGTYIKQLVKFLQPTEANVSIINLSSEQNSPEIITIDGIEIFNLPYPTYIMGEKNLSRYYQSVGDFLSLYVDRFAENIFHFNYLSHYLLPDIIKNIFPKSRTIVTVHYLNWLFHLKGNTKQFLQIMKKQETEQTSSEKIIMKEYSQDKTFFNSVDHIICLANYTLVLLKNYYGIAYNKLNLIRNGISLDDIKILNTKERIEKKRQLHITPKEKLILFVGRLDALKGIEYLIEAFQQVLISIPECRLWIVGDGDFSLGLNKANGIWNRITMTGRIPQESLFTLYQIADIGVIPSLSEQCSYVAIEMMSFGLPIISTSTSGLKEMLPSSNNTIELTETDKDIIFPIEQLTSTLINALHKKKHIVTPAKAIHPADMEEIKSKILNLYLN